MGYLRALKICIEFGGSVIKNLPTNEGDIGSIPGLGRLTCLGAKTVDA